MDSSTTPLMFDVQSYESYIIYAYVVSAVILGWMVVRTLRMLKKSHAKLKQAEAAARTS